MHEKKEIPVIRGAVVLVREIPSGRYLVRWWDTRTSEVVRRETVNTSNGEVKLVVPVLADDTAVLLSPEND